MGRMSESLERGGGTLWSAWKNCFIIILRRLMMGSWERAFVGGGRRRRWAGHLVGMPEPRFPALEDLVGLEDEIAVVEKNTRYFLAGGEANHVLITGGAGWREVFDCAGGFRPLCGAGVAVD